MLNLLVQFPQFAEQLTHATSYLGNFNEQVKYAKVDDRAGNELQRTVHSQEIAYGANVYAFMSVVSLDAYAHVVDGFLRG